MGRTKDGPAELPRCWCQKTRIAQDWRPAGESEFEPEEKWSLPSGDEAVLKHRFACWGPHRKKRGGLQAGRRYMRANMVLFSSPAILSHTGRGGVQGSALHKQQLLALHRRYIRKVSR